ncbi:MAG TPA: hypothetical protein VN828_04730, partial [Acidobacteriaceae bacterium]|nr:hypothetical protein [Acidobacteriaceae bacterium]
MAGLWGPDFDDRTKWQFENQDQGDPQLHQNKLVWAISRGEEAGPGIRFHRWVSVNEHRGGDRGWPGLLCQLFGRGAIE